MGEADGERRRGPIRRGVGAVGRYARWKVIEAGWVFAVSVVVLVLVPVWVMDVVDRSFVVGYAVGYLMEVVDGARVPLVGLGFVWGLACLGLRWWGVGAALVASAVVGGWPVVMDAVWRTGGSAAGASLVVYSHNVLYGRADAGAVADQVAVSGADVVFIQEHTAGFGERFGPMMERAGYAHAWEALAAHGVGMAVYSREPMVVGVGDVVVGGRGVAHPVASSGRGDLLRGMPQPMCVVEVDGREVVVLNAHWSSPMGPERAWRRRWESRAVAAWARERIGAGAAVVVVGDTNAVAWSGSVSRLRVAGLTDAFNAVGVRGPGLTWGTGRDWELLRWVLNARIDRALVGGGAAPVWFERYGKAGGDHRGIAVGVAIEGAGD